MQFRRCVPEQGFTLTEAVVAAAISALFLSSLFTMNLSSMETIRSAKESTVASQVLQQRLESMRIANWHQITDAAWIRDNLLNLDAAGGEQLKNLVETVLLVPYGSTTIGNTTLRRSLGAATIVTQNTDLLLENAVKVIWTVDYTGAPNNHAVTHQIVAILAKGGVAK
jgi:type II secretory pathway pseudopilin PulG